MVHLAPADNIFGQVVETVLVEDIGGYFHLFVTFRWPGGCHGGEPDRAAATAPVVIGELLERAAPHHHLAAKLEIRVVLGLFFGDYLHLVAELGLERTGDILPGQGHLLGGSVNGGIKTPGPDVALFDYLLDNMGWEYPLPFVERIPAGRFTVLIIVAVAGRLQKRIHHDAGVGNELAQAQRHDGLDDIGQHLHLGKFHQEGEIAPRWRSLHQPESHLGDDAVVGLGKDTVHVRTRAPFGSLPAGGVWHATHAGTDHVAVGQYHFHAAGEEEMISVGSIAGSSVERVPHGTDNC